ncbi:TonB-dependent receptor [Cellulophaga sp. 20_2_10]|uniref:TonB-dependent receptor domain-containing protein n=1 Tax=Cellulophaga sp. 20_2_10 TaxID=2942476 RepID=UPI00201A74AF|nr:TonB-dependent receptor [Cellulophaga sp. 20_2_10]MCL5244758.1 TonB-dependent receptor [Cellulophaga sp. 20_2_10]
MKHLFSLVLLFATVITYAQGPNAQKTDPKKVKITGAVVDDETGDPLEYATLILQSVKDPSIVTGGITDEQGKFNVTADAGMYHIKVEFLSYKTYTLNNQDLSSSRDLGIIKLALDVEQLDAVVITAEKTTVQLRLDKKIYNVGKDLTVKGGSVTDVLNNVPSVDVDVEGAISLRGNESVKILINGKPSALSGLDNAALKSLPADAIERIEVVTNPSARYDAEGTAGILNIILKQSKTAGLNGSVSATVGDPEQYAGSANINLRRDKFNLYTNLSYRDRTGPGNAFYENQYLDEDGNPSSFENEYREYTRSSKSYNANIGFEYFIDETSSITNSVLYRNSNGLDLAEVNFFNFDGNMTPTIERQRTTNEDDDEETVQYSLNYEKRFNEDGNKLTVDYQYSRSDELENASIEEVVSGSTTNSPLERTITDNNQIKQLVQLDYVLPFGKDFASQFEAGYRGNFNNYTTDYDFGQEIGGTFNSDPNFSNTLFFNETVNAAYVQLGTKIDKFSILGGIRVEDTDIEIELAETNDINTKKYTNWFPSVFLGYELSEMEQFTVSYSKRLRRPGSWFINPFPSRSSNTNLFYGNPDLDPTFTDAYDLGYLKRWDKVLFNISGYYNHSTGVFQFITQETGEFVSISDPSNPGTSVEIPVQARTPINLATESRYGLDITSTYTPMRNWRFSLNLNLYQQNVEGEHSYTNFQNQVITQVFDADNFSWFSKFSAKIPLPAKIDFQTNLTYRGPSENAQTIRKGMFGSDLALSKDLLNDKATLSLSVNDIFNTRKRISESTTENIISNSEFQWRQRSASLTFTYRFNQQKNQRSKGEMKDNGGDMEMQG